MEEQVLTTEELLWRWRDATRAAELAERLAKLAAESVERSDRDAVSAEEIAEMAERTAASAERAAKSARAVADRATAFARENRGGRLAEADTALSETKGDEAAARDRFHVAEREARKQHGS